MPKGRRKGLLRDIARKYLPDSIVDRFRYDYENITQYTREAGQLLPTPSGMLPANGTMPDPKGGILSSNPAPPVEDEPRRRSSAGRKKGHLR